MLLVLIEDLLQELKYRSRSLSLFPYENDGRRSRLRQSQNLGKVPVEGDNHSALCKCVSQDFPVFRFVHADFPYMHRIPAQGAQHARCSCRHALIEQYPPHAASS
jgi:hypothetical protein